MKEHFEISTSFTLNDISLVGTHKKFAIRKETVTCVVTAYMGFFFIEWLLHNIEYTETIVSPSTKFVELWSSQKEVKNILTAKGNHISKDWASLSSYLLLGNVLWFIPQPNINKLLRNICQCGDKLVIFWWKSYTYVLLIFLFQFCSWDDNFLPFKSFCIVDHTEWGPFSAFSYRDKSLIMTYCYRCNGLGAVSSRNITLGFLLCVIKYNIMAHNIANFSFTNEMKVIWNISFDACHEFRF